MKCEYGNSHGFCALLSIGESGGLYAAHGVCNKLYMMLFPVQFFSSVNFPIQLNFKTRMQQNSYA